MRRRRITAKAILALCCAAAGAARAHYPSPEDWRDINIYQIFTDRFFDGDAANNNSNPFEASVPTDSRRIHGGDFAGITAKLDYLRALGATAIWISPIPLNVPTSAYHGYAAHDFFTLAPQWGTLAELSNMVAAAHARGIYVILDVVCNHQGNRIDSTDSGYPAFAAPPGGYTLRWRTGTPFPAPFDDLSRFHNHGGIQNFADPEQILGELSSLDDLRTEDEYVRTNLFNIYRHWISAADFDGFRLDTTKHVDIGLWQSFNPAIRSFAASLGKTNFFQFGEVFDGSDEKCGYYTGTKAGGAFANDAVLDFPLFFTARDTFARAWNATGPIESHYNVLSNYYDPAAQTRLVTFLDNHDNARFLHASNASNHFERLEVGLTFLYTSRGVPCLYYGTEQAFNGGGDPDNREDLFDGLFEQGPSLGDNFNMCHPFFLQLSRLNNFRRLYPSLRRGEHVNLWNDPDSPGLFAYARRLGSEEVFVALNTSYLPQTLTNRPTQYAAGTVLVNLLDTNETVTVVAGMDGLPPITVPGMSAKLLLAQSSVRPLDPLVTNQVPAHGATNVSPLQPLVLRFSQPMDTATVENALSVQPPVTGSFAWADGDRRVSFTPAGDSWNAFTKYTVRLEDTARDQAASNTLHGPFETFFVSGFLPTDAVPPYVAINQPAPGSVLTNGIVVSGVATDNASVVLVEVRLDGQAWSAASGSAAWTFALDTARGLNGSHTIAARAADSSGNASATSSVAVQFFNVPGPYEQRIAPGSPSDLTNCDASVWLADRAHASGSFGYSNGAAGYIANAISGVCASAQALYQRERYSLPGGDFEYLFDAPPGVYEITLLEAENWVTGPGLRRFNLFIEDAQALTNFDIYAAAGGPATPVTLVFTAAVADTRLNLRFVPQVENARASGIRARKIGDFDSDGDGIPDWWMLGHFDHAAGEAGDQSRAGDDADADGFSTLDEFLLRLVPLQADPRFDIVGLLFGDSQTVSFQSVSGLVYSLHGAPALAGSPEWLAVATNVPGDGDVVSITDTNAHAFRVYRVGAARP
jgi:glycosidase